MKSTKKLTVTALLAAVGTVLLTLGSLIEVLDLSMAAIVSCFVVFLRIELRGGYPYLFWAVTSLCSLLLMPSSSAALLFTLIGLYPLSKAVLERRHPVVEWLFKLALAGSALTLFVLAAKFVLLLPDAILSGWLLPVFLAVSLAAFVLYDIALSRLIVFYGFRIRPRISRFLK